MLLLSVLFIIFTIAFIFKRDYSILLSRITLSVLFEAFLLNYNSMHLNVLQQNFTIYNNLIHYGTQYHLMSNIYILLSIFFLLMLEFYLYNTSYKRTVSDVIVEMWFKYVKYVLTLVIVLILTINFSNSIYTSVNMLVLLISFIILQKINPKNIRDLNLAKFIKYNVLIKMILTFLSVNELHFISLGLIYLLYTSILVSIIASKNKKLLLLKLTVKLSFITVFWFSLDSVGEVIVYIISFSDPNSMYTCNILSGDTSDFIENGRMTPPLTWCTYEKINIDKLYGPLKLHSQSLINRLNDKEEFDIERLKIYLNSVCFYGQRIDDIENIKPRDLNNLSYYSWNSTLYNAIPEENKIIYNSEINYDLQQVIKNINKYKISKDQDDQNSVKNIAYSDQDIYKYLIKEAYRYDVKYKINTDYKIGIFNGLSIDEMIEDCQFKVFDLSKMLNTLIKAEKYLLDLKLEEKYQNKDLQLECKDSLLWYRSNQLFKFLPHDQIKMQELSSKNFDCHAYQNRYSVYQYGFTTNTLKDVISNEGLIKEIQLHKCYCKFDLLKNILPIYYSYNNDISKLTKAEFCRVLNASHEDIVNKCKDTGEFKKILRDLYERENHIENYGFFTNSREYFKEDSDAFRILAKNALYKNLSTFCESSPECTKSFCRIDEAKGLGRGLVNMNYKFFVYSFYGLKEWSLFPPYGDHMIATDHCYKSFKQESNKIKPLYGVEEDFYLPKGYFDMNSYLPNLCRDVVIYKSYDHTIDKIYKKNIEKLDDRNSNENVTYSLKPLYSGRLIIDKPSDFNFKDYISTQQKSKCVTNCYIVH